MSLRDYDEFYTEENYQIYLEELARQEAYNQAVAEAAAAAEAELIASLNEELAEFLPHEGERD